MWLPLRLFIACLVYPKLFNRVALLLETAKAHDKNGMLSKIAPWQYRTGLASNPLKDCLSLIKDNMGNETPLTTSDGIKWAPSSESIPLKFHMERHLASAQIFLSIRHSFFLNSQLAKKWPRLLLHTLKRAPWPSWPTRGKCIEGVFWELSLALLVQKIQQPYIFRQTG